MDYKNDRVDTTRMDKKAEQIRNKMERKKSSATWVQSGPNSQRPASVETVHGGVPSYGVKETLVVDGKW